jgi:hypothetical protein
MDNGEIGTVAEAQALANRFNADIFLTDMDGTYVGQVTPTV